MIGYIHIGGIFIETKSIKIPFLKKYIKDEDKIKYVVLVVYALSLVIFGLLMDKPENILRGLFDIIKEPDALISDYIGVGGMGAAFVNSGFITLISILILWKLNINISGAAISSIFIVSGFSLFGENIFNIWFILGGVYLYARYQNEKFAKYIYIALIGTGLAPMVTQIMFNTDKPHIFNILLGIFIGIGLGFILPPLSSYLMRVHQGFNLYNIGFTAGIIGTILVSILRSYGYNISGRLVWTKGNDLILGIYLFMVLMFFIVTGFLLDKKAIVNVKKIFSYPGRLVTDFVLLEGFPATLINMGISGISAMIYVIIVGGSLNGPTIGGILTITGFSAFGKHLRNIIPIFIGVYIASITKIWRIDDPVMLLSALFGTTLAPISGEFGWKMGMLAGFIICSVTINVGYLHGGLNLYNVGFAGGIVAAAMVPVIEAIRKDD